MIFHWSSSNLLTTMQKIITNVDLTVSYMFEGADNFIQMEKMLVKYVTITISLNS